MAEVKHSIVRLARAILALKVPVNSGANRWATLGAAGRGDTSRRKSLNPILSYEETRNKPVHLVMSGGGKSSSMG
jgi:hypothetical protein